jgi:hypothetical protein
MFTDYFSTGFGEDIIWKTYLKPFFYNKKGGGYLDWTGEVSIPPFVLPLFEHSGGLLKQGTGLKPRVNPGKVCPKLEKFDWVGGLRAEAPQ